MTPGNCSYERTGANEDDTYHYRCTECGHERDSRYPPRMLHQKCPSSPPGSPPSLRRQAWNLAKSLAAFVADGCKLVSKPDYQARLKICDTCEYRRHNRCLKCGCRLSVKAQGRAFRCPEGRWATPVG